MGKTLLDKVESGFLTEWETVQVANGQLSSGSWNATRYCKGNVNRDPKPWDSIVHSLDSKNGVLVDLSQEIKQKDETQQDSTHNCEAKKENGEEKDVKEVNDKTQEIMETKQSHDNTHVGEEKEGKCDNTEANDKTSENDKT